MIYYGLRIKKTQQLACLQVNSDIHFDGATSEGNSYDVELTTPSGAWGEQVYLNSEKRHVEETLRGVSYYASSLNTPYLGTFKTEDLELVEIELMVK